MDNEGNYDGDSRTRWSSTIQQFLPFLSGSLGWLSIQPNSFPKRKGDNSYDMVMIEEVPQVTGTCVMC